MIEQGLPQNEKGQISFCGSSFFSVVLFFGQYCVDLLQLFLCKGGSIQDLHVLLQLLRAAGADQDSGHAGIPQYPLKRHLCQRLSPFPGDGIQAGYPAKVSLIQIPLDNTGAFPGSPGVLRHTV